MVFDDRTLLREIKSVVCVKAPFWLSYVQYFLDFIKKKSKQNLLIRK